MTEDSLAVGIDIGGSKTAIGLIDRVRGAILAHRVIDTPARAETGLAFLTTVAGIAKSLCDGRAPGDTAPSVGIGVCEFVESSGSIVSAHRVIFDRSIVRSAFSGFGGVAVEADVRCAAIAEAQFGHGKGLVHWIYVNAGTGISSVLMKEAACYGGAHGWALGLGMSPADLAAERTAPNDTLIEDVSGGSGLLRRAQACGLPVGSVRELIGLASSESRDAAAIVEDGGRALGRAIAMLVNILDPEAVVVGGGLVNSQSRYWHGLTEAAARHIWHGPAKRVPIRQAALRTHAGLIGAALAGRGR